MTHRRDARRAEAEGGRQRQERAAAGAKKPGEAGKRRQDAVDAEAGSAGQRHRRRARLRRRRRRKATYTGDAQLWQGETSIKGDVDRDRRQDRRPRRRPAASSRRRCSSRPTRTRRRRSACRRSRPPKDFKYDDASRRATYTRRRAHERPAGRHDRGAKIELYPEAVGRRARARRGVRRTSTLREQSRKTTGERLTYTTADETLRRHRRAGDDRRRMRPRNDRPDVDLLQGDR